jgi:hypothetical protein
VFSQGRIDEKKVIPRKTLNCMHKSQTYSIAKGGHVLNLINESYHNSHFPNNLMYGECLMSSLGCSHLNFAILEREYDSNLHELLNENDMLLTFNTLPLAGFEMLSELYTQALNDF